MRAKPAKRLGQHFLVSHRVARVFSSWVCGFRKVLEIGPGTGFITTHVLRGCSDVEVLAGVEIDGRLVDELISLSLASPVLQVVQGDILHTPLRLEGFDAVYGSIPYNITGPLISLLAKGFQKPALLLVQKEVAERLSASPGSKNYGRLTVLVALVYRVRKVMTVPPSAFRPRPRVYSQIVELVPRARIPAKTLSLVEDITRCFFSQRNRVASKVARRCLGQEADIKGASTKALRVFELKPEFFLEMAERYR